MNKEQNTDTWSIKEVADALEEHGLIREQEPCEDAISRQAVLDALRDAENHAFNAFYKGLIKAHKIVANLPSVTPQPKMGRWIYDNFDWRCSKCNEAPKTLGYVGTAIFMSEHFKYCNHCGARMIEPQESEVQDADSD